MFGILPRLRDIRLGIRLEADVSQRYNSHGLRNPSVSYRKVTFARMYNEGNNYCQFSGLNLRQVQAGYAQPALALSYT